MKEAECVRIWGRMGCMGSILLITWEWSSLMNILSHLSPVRHNILTYDFFAGVYLLR